MKLFSTTRMGLQNMIDICKEFDVNYNEKKTVAFCFSRSNEMIQFDVYLNNKETAMCW